MRVHALSLKAWLGLQMDVAIIRRGGQLIKQAVWLFLLVIKADQTLSQKGSLCFIKMDEVDL